MSSDADVSELVHRIKDIYVKELMTNPGNAVGYNPDQYLKNLAYAQRNYKKTMKAVRDLENYFYFQKVKITCSTK